MADATNVSGPRVPAGGRRLAFRIGLLTGLGALLAAGALLGVSLTGTPSNHRATTTTSTSAPPGSSSSNTSPVITTTTTTTTTTTPSRSGNLLPGHWLIASAALQLLLPNPLAVSLENSADTYLIVNDTTLGLVPASSQATLVASFTSFAALNSALTDGTLSPRIKAVLYDNEAWTLTPQSEQLNYAAYEQQAAQAAHSHGLQFIATPSVSLANVIDPGSGATFDKYLSVGIAANAARYADVFDIQAQGSQLDPAKYAAFVTSAAAQARQANPNVVVLAGLSTNPSGPSIPLSDLLSVVQSTRQAVNGYWLNVPRPGTACPNCNAPQPQLAISLLEQLSSQ
ncbi:MAG: hypothetical protein ACRDV4_03280 [Acidimicrobiales bacterium]